MAETMFEKLASIDVSGKIEKKKTGENRELSYLSWTYAWSEFKKVYPDATYNIRNFVTDNDTLVPYMYDTRTGYMVMTDVTAEGLTYTMWLPVMDSNNRAMKDQPYKIITSKGKEINVAAATMFDINKAIMRCLVKNLAMFGLGLYIYAGEDVPEDFDPLTVETKIEKKDNLLRIINKGTQDEVKEAYQKNKKLISSTPELMDAITERSKQLKGLQ